MHGLSSVKIWAFNSFLFFDYLNIHFLPNLIFAPNNLVKPRISISERPELTCRLTWFYQISVRITNQLTWFYQVSIALLIKLRGFAKLVQSSMVDCSLVKPRKSTKFTDIEHKSSFYNFISVQILGEFYNNLAVNVFYENM